MDGDAVAIARMHKQRAHFFQIENNTLHRDLSSKYEEVFSLRQENAALKADNTKLKQQVAELTRTSSAKREQDVPAFVKANVADRPQRRPGRKKGHAAALRPRPRKIDVTLDIPLPVDRRRKRCCPHCRAQLSDVKHHQRLAAVVMRKITGGSRSESGAEAWAILARVMRTAQQQSRDVVATIRELLRAIWAGREAATLTDSS